MTDPLYLGIDVGTSSVRCCVIDHSCQLVTSSKVDLPAPENPLAGQYEQSPYLWWDAVKACIAKLSDQIQLNDIKALAIDGTSSTVLLADENNTPLGNALMYNDSRSVIMLEKMRAFVPASHITLSASSSLAKALYLLEHSSKHAAHVLHQADWLNTLFLGKSAISDENNCLKLGFDSVAQQWPEWMKKIPGNFIEKLPRVYPSGRFVGKIDPTTAQSLGLSVETAVVTGTTDSTASSIATGIEKKGEAITTIGTTLVMKVNSDKPVTSVEDGVYSHRLANGSWLVGGASNSGGNVLLNFFSVEQIQRLSDLINPHQPTGLNYYPLLDTGERFPINDPGLAPRLEPRPESDTLFLQAIFEGFANIEKAAYDKLEKLGAPRPSIIFTAGGAAAKNKTLTKIRAAILEIPIQQAHHTEASYGSALIARNAIS